MFNRIFLIVLDSVGAGALPDAEEFGDAGTNTLRSVSKSDSLTIPHLISMGMANIDSLSFLGPVSSPSAAYCRLSEKSRGKDTTIGHWEIAGIISDKPLPTYPNGFPSDIIDKFSKSVGRKVLCNMPYSGTEVINKFGDEHVKTGSLIVYTSADSVFQIAAHEDIVPLKELYSCCETARKLLKGNNAVGRVIARPFIGSNSNYKRTKNRRDFSLEPPDKTILDAVSSSGFDCISVGKINDIFAGRGITRSLSAHGNIECMKCTADLAYESFSGLAFINLVDFDMLYGHRNNTDGYAKALSEFDIWLGKFKKLLKDDDVLIITADHGCDPGDISTDHSREYVPMLVYGNRIIPKNLGTRDSFTDIAATISDMLNLNYTCKGKSFLPEICKI